VALGLAWAYWPNLRDLAWKWSDDPNYSHGYLVVPIALAILWQRRDTLDPARARPHWAGWAALLGVLAARAWLFERNEQWIESATIPLAAGALVLAFGGWYLLRWALPAVAFLWFMLPLPPRINIVLAGPLQRLATDGSTTLLQLLGLPVMSQGNVIFVGTRMLNVEQACNGLSMLLSFVTLITATTILVRSRPVWERVILLFSTVPIALVSNVLRITITAWAYHQFGPEAVVFPGWSPVFAGWTVEKFVHDTAGWAMMPIALALVFLELRLLAWLFVEERVRRGPLVVAPTYAPAMAARKKPAGEGPARGRAADDLS
jgi:exosortase